MSETITMTRTKMEEASKEQKNSAEALNDKLQKNIIDDSILAKLTELLEIKKTEDSSGSEAMQKLIQEVYSKASDDKKTEINNYLDGASKVKESLISEQKSQKEKDVDKVATSNEKKDDVKEKAKTDEVVDVVPEGKKEDLSKAVVDAVEILPVDQPILHPTNERFEVINSIQLMNTPLQSKNKLMFSGEFYCFQDHSIAEDYVAKINESILRLDEAKKKAEAAKNDGDFTEVKKLNEQIKLINAEIIAAYSAKDQPSKYSGYKIVRKDKMGHKTNLAGGASQIEIDTMGLNEKNAVRIRLAGGEFLELHLNKNGDFDIDGELNDIVIPLTNVGAEQSQLFQGDEHRKDFLYNDYNRVLEDLNKLESIKVNGIEISFRIREAIQQRYDNQQAMIEASKKREKNEKPQEQESEAEKLKLNKSTQTNSINKASNEVSESRLDIGNQDLQRNNSQNNSAENNETTSPLDFGYRDNKATKNPLSKLSNKDETKQNNSEAAKLKERKNPLELGLPPR